MRGNGKGRRQIMLRKVLVVVGSIVILLLGCELVKAAELEVEPFLYTQDFEGDKDPVKFWCSDMENIP